MKYNIPKTFTEETRYIKIFTKKSLLYTFIGLCLGIPILGFLSKKGYPFLGIVIVLVICIPLYAIGTIKYSKDLLFDGGEPLDKVIFRRLRNLIEGKVIYVSKGKRS